MYSGSEIYRLILLSTRTKWNIHCRQHRHGASIHSPTIAFDMYLLCTVDTNINYQFVQMFADVSKNNIHFQYWNLKLVAWDLDLTAVFMLCNSLKNCLSFPRVVICRIFYYSAHHLYSLKWYAVYCVGIMTYLKLVFPLSTVRW